MVSALLRHRGVAGKLFNDLVEGFIEALDHCICSACFQWDALTISLLKMMFDFGLFGLRNPCVGWKRTKRIASTAAG